MTKEDAQLICPLAFEDPWSGWALVEKDIFSLFPLKSISWKNSLDQEDVRIDTLPLRCMPSSANLFKDTDHPFRWFLAPYVELYVFVCEGVDSYKTNKSKLKTWLDSQNSIRRISSLVVYVPMGSQQMEVYQKIFAKLSSELTSERPTDRCIFVVPSGFRNQATPTSSALQQASSHLIPTTNHHVDSAASIQDLSYRLKEIVISSFQARVNRYTTEIKRLEENKGSSSSSSPAADFRQLFLVKESLALMYQMMQMSQYALKQYDELQALLSTIPLDTLPPSFWPLVTTTDVIKSSKSSKKSKSDKTEKADESSTSLSSSSTAPSLLTSQMLTLALSQNLSSKNQSMDMDLSVTSMSTRDLVKIDYSSHTSLDMSTTISSKYFLHREINTQVPFFSEVLINGDNLFSYSINNSRMKVLKNKIGLSELQVYIFSRRCYFLLYQGKISKCLEIGVAYIPRLADLMISRLLDIYEANMTVFDLLEGAKKSLHLAKIEASRAEAMAMTVVPSDAANDLNSHATPPPDGDAAATGSETVEEAKALEATKGGDTGEAKVVAAIAGGTAEPATAAASSETKPKPIPEAPPAPVAVPAPALNTLEHVQHPLSKDTIKRALRLWAVATATALLKASQDSVSVQAEGLDLPSILTVLSKKDTIPLTPTMFGVTSSLHSLCDIMYFISKQLQNVTLSPSCSFRRNTKFAMRLAAELTDWSSFDSLKSKYPIIFRDIIFSREQERVPLQEFDKSLDITTVNFMDMLKALIIIQQVFVDSQYLNPSVTVDSEHVVPVMETEVRVLITQYMWLARYYLVLGRRRFAWRIYIQCADLLLCNGLVHNALRMYLEALTTMVPLPMAFRRSGGTSGSSEKDTSNSKGRRMNRAKSVDLDRHNWNSNTSESTSTNGRFDSSTTGDDSTTQRGIEPNNPITDNNYFESPMKLQNNTNIGISVDEMDVIGEWKVIRYWLLRKILLCARMLDDRLIYVICGLQLLSPVFVSVLQDTNKDRKQYEEFQPKALLDDILMLTIDKLASNAGMGVGIIINNSVMSMFSTDKSNVIAIGPRVDHWFETSLHPIFQTKLLLTSDRKSLPEGGKVVTDDAKEANADVKERSTSFTNTRGKITYESVVLFGDAIQARVISFEGGQSLIDLALAACSNLPNDVTVDDVVVRYVPYSESVVNALQQPTPHFSSSHMIVNNHNFQEYVPAGSFECRMKPSDKKVLLKSISRETKKDNDETKDPNHDMQFKLTEDNYSIFELLVEPPSTGLYIPYSITIRVVGVAFVDRLLYNPLRFLKDYYMLNILSPSKSIAVNLFTPLFSPYGCKDSVRVQIQCAKPGDSLKDIAISASWSDVNESSVKELEKDPKSFTTSLSIAATSEWSLAETSKPPNMRFEGKDLIVESVGEHPSRPSIILNIPFVPSYERKNVSNTQGKSLYEPIVNDMESKASLKSQSPLGSSDVDSSQSLQSLSMNNNTGNTNHNKVIGDGSNSNNIILIDKFIRGNKSDQSNNRSEADQKSSMRKEGMKDEMSNQQSVDLSKYVITIRVSGKLIRQKCEMQINSTIKGDIQAGNPLKISCVSTPLTSRSTLPPSSTSPQTSPKITPGERGGPLQNVDTSAMTSSFYNQITISNISPCPWSITNLLLHSNKQPITLIRNQFHILREDKHNPAGQTTSTITSSPQLSHNGNQIYSSNSKDESDSRSLSSKSNSKGITLAPGEQYCTVVELSVPIDWKCAYPESDELPYSVYSTTDPGKQEKSYEFSGKRASFSVDLQRSCPSHSSSRLFAKDIHLSYIVSSATEETVTLSKVGNKETARDEVSLSEMNSKEMIQYFQTNTFQSYCDIKYPYTISPSNTKGEWKVEVAKVKSLLSVSDFIDGEVFCHIIGNSDNNPQPNQDGDQAKKLNYVSLAFSTPKIFQMGESIDCHYRIILRGTENPFLSWIQHLNNDTKNYNKQSNNLSKKDTNKVNGRGTTDDKEAVVKLRLSVCESSDWVVMGCLRKVVDYKGSKMEVLFDTQLISLVCGILHVPPILIEVYEQQSHHETQEDPVDKLEVLPSEPPRKACSMAPMMVYSESKVHLESTGRTSTIATTRQPLDK